MTRRARLSLMPLFGVLSLLLPEAASAQIFAPVCIDPACSQVEFVITAPSTGLELNSLTLTMLNDSFRFEPAGGVGSYSASDDLGPFGGFTTVNVAGTQLFIDFLADIGGPFTLGGGSIGGVQAPVLNLTGETDADALTFRYEAALAGGGTLTGSVAPEPASMLLLGTGLAGLVAARRRRRKLEA